MHAGIVRPKRRLTDPKEFDGLVWSGMLSDPKLSLDSKIDVEDIMGEGKSVVMRWNRELFGSLNDTKTDKLKRHVQLKTERFVFEQCSSLLNRIGIKEPKIIETLLQYESYETVIDELERSKDALMNISLEMPHLLGGHIRYMSSFLPVNLPLYSSVIFGFIPSLMAERVFVRAPQKARKIYAMVQEELFEDYFALCLREDGRKEFIDNYVSNSDVVLFTGRYKNALEIESHLRKALLIYNGAGINPIVVGNNAKMQETVKSVLKARLFNSGQDCAGPDCVLVQDSSLDEFLSQLYDALENIKSGDYTDRETRVGRLIDPIPEVIRGDIFHQEKDNVRYGGVVESGRNLVHPTVIVKPLSEFRNYREFFSPIIWVSPYQHEEELELFFNTPEYKDHAMYVSIFGDLACASKIPQSVILHEKTVLDVERGNLTYGGYGNKANFISIDGKRVSRPILISKEIAGWCKTRK